MEFLVTMTTHVPEGTSDVQVEEVKSREAAHSRGLADEGRLIRLWRPPLKPGEWRTFGLFDAADRGELEAVLRSMPLRVWRTDDIVPLEPHANDPGRRGTESESPGPTAGNTEFFTTFTVTVPPGTPRQRVDEANAHEATRARDLAGQGLLERLWTLPGNGRTLGLWRARDTREMREIVEALPLRDWSDVETIQLSAHPSDPAVMGT